MITCGSTATRPKAARQPRVSQGDREMIAGEYAWSRRLRSFGYFLLVWKIIIAINLSIAGPIFERMRLRGHPEDASDWMTVKIMVLSYLIGALSGYFIIRKYLIAALAFLFIEGSLMFAHYIYINKTSVFGFLIAYWEIIVLAIILWRMYKTPKNI